MYVCTRVRHACIRVCMYVCTYAYINVLYACMYVSACAMSCYVMYVRVSYAMLCFVMLYMHTCIGEMYVCVNRDACMKHIQIHIY